MNAVQVLRLHADVELEALLEGLDGSNDSSRGQ